MGCGSIHLLKVFDSAGGWVDEHDKMRCSRLHDGRMSGDELFCRVSFIMTWLPVSWSEL